MNLTGKLFWKKQIRVDAIFEDVDLSIFVSLLSIYFEEKSKVEK